jgi:hypothetical protein
MTDPGAEGGAPKKAPPKPGPLPVFLPGGFRPPIPKFLATADGNCLKSVIGYERS